MMKFIMPVILIGIAITCFFMFTSPMYNDITVLQTQVGSYNDALDNSKALENDQNTLTSQYNAIDPNNLAKLQKLLPDNIDNIRLILEIGKIASPYGMVLKDVKYNTTESTSTATGTTVAGAIQGGGTPVAVSNKNYGVWNLEFSTQGTYNNFINFTKDMESNLRIVDVSSIDFSSDASAGLNTSTSGSPSYTYDFKIKTYWLKN